MKCPYCGEELKEWDRRLYCENMACSANHEDLPQFIWQDLINGKKAQRQPHTVKDRCVKKIKAKEREIRGCLNGMSVRQSENERLAKQLRRAQDALDVAVDTLKYIRRTNPISFHFEAIEKALEQITALEQKDVK